ncbi:MAG: cyclic lactone autoinducer peptide [Wujia sp.]
MINKNGEMVRKTINDAIKKIAVIKVNANCVGFMYEPKKPNSMIKK